MPSRALLLLNPRARRGADAAGDIAAGLRRAGLELVAPFLKWGTHVKRREVEAPRAKVFDIRTRPPMSIDVDGKLGAETPGRFEVVPRDLEVFTPEPASA
jgi:diacylglycerol kinase family enzyme